MAAHNPQFGCFTLPKPAENVFVSDIGPDGLPTRQRKIHGKSRYGCRNCKERKVKCDEKNPCGHCVKRKETCSLSSCTSSVSKRNLSSAKKISSSAIRRRPVVQEPLQNTSLTSFINIQHLQLLHHFENHTYESFAFPPESWKDTVITLALEHPFLMQAVFLVTASHLQHLQPHNNVKREMVLEHLSLALPSFRRALDAAAGCSQSYKDALMAASLLLLQYSWESPIPDIDSDDDGWDTLLGLYAGVRNLVFTFWVFKHGGSRFTPWLVYSPKLSIETYLANQPIPPDIEASLSHVITCTKISVGDAEHMVDLDAIVAQRLVPIWCALKLGMKALEASPIFLDVGRYLFTFPNVHAANLSTKTERSQVILLYYFAGVIRFRYERFWWVRKRAIYMFDLLFRRLEEKCEVCTGMAKQLRDEDYP